VIFIVIHIGVTIVIKVIITTGGPNSTPRAVSAPSQCLRAFTFQVLTLPLTIARYLPYLLTGDLVLAVMLLSR
jgi:hypothetical protein